ncbi:MAG TPA: alpha/beta hydrolase [Verrucomicrobiae bacterium]
MKFIYRWRIAIGLLIAGLSLGGILLWGIAGVLISPAPRLVGPAPADLAATNVVFPGGTGTELHGWLIRGRTGGGAVALLHGNRSDRTQMLSRARYFSKAGYTVLLFDFQAHGESPGNQLTLGDRESHNATAAVAYLHEQVPGEKIGVVGMSLGAASVLLAEPPLPVQTMVLESSYPTIQDAVRDRMVERMGSPGRWITPLLTCQMRPRLGFGPDHLRPIDHVAKITVPKFFIAGTADQLTTLAESQALYDAAAEPKQSWWVAGAGHEDMHDFSRHEYEEKVGAFLGRYLRAE